MPLYIYEHPKTEEVIELIQGMNDKHEYIDDKGVKWNRLFSKPQAKTVTIDPFSARDFVEKTRGTRGTVGDLWDQSAELSAARTKRYGYDPVKDKTVKDYEKKCKTSHPLANKTS